MVVYPDENSRNDAVDIACLFVRFEGGLLAVGAGIWSTVEKK